MISSLSVNRIGLAMNDFKAFRVDNANWDGFFYTLKIDAKRVDDPNDNRELVIVFKSDKSRMAIFRDKEWCASGPSLNQWLTLFKPEYAAGRPRQESASED